MNTRQEINEASLNRLYQHVLNSEFQSFAILTSWRQEKSSKDNRADFKKLTSEVRSLGHGFVNLMGHGQEDDPVTGNVVSVKEPSIFIIGISRRDAERLMKKWNQWGIVYSGPDTGGNVVMVQQSGGDFLLSKAGAQSFRPAMIAKYYSRLRGRPFVIGTGSDAGGGGIRHESNSSNRTGGPRHEASRAAQRARIEDELDLAWDSSDDLPFFFEEVPGWMEGFGKSIIERANNLLDGSNDRKE